MTSSHTSGSDEPETAADADSPTPPKTKHSSNGSGGEPSDRHPVSRVQWVPLEKVEANSYNPNRVAPNELRLLYTSIKADGYTQPVVTIYDEAREKYVIVDGFHRWLILKRYPDIRETTNGLLPIVT